MRQHDSARDVADRITRMAAQLVMYGAAAPDDRMKRLIFVTAVSRVPYLKDAVELQE